MDLRVGVVSTAAPRLTVQTAARSDVDLSGVTMTIGYVGAASDFAEYTPISTHGSTQLQFQFDALLFDSAYGFYRGTLWFNGVPFVQLQFRYTSDASVPPALQLSTTGPYAPTDEFAVPNWSGNETGGPGTFIGLKDCPKTYAGAAGWAPVVNDTETGLRFRPAGPSIDNRAPWLGLVYGVPAAQVSAGVFAWDAEIVAQNIALTLVGDTLIAVPDNLLPGMVFNFTVDQDLAGGHVLAFAPMFKWPGGTAPTWATAPLARNSFQARYDGSILRCVGFAGFA